VNASNERAEIYRFGNFEVDTLAHQLRKQGVRLRLQDQPYQILLLLLERAGQVVTRDELRQRIWPSSVFVDFDHGLNNAISRLREVLGDAAATPRFIETIPRVGYRFLDTVTVLPGEAAVATLASHSPESASQPPAATVRSTGKRRQILAAGVAAAVLIAALLRLGLADRQGVEKHAANAVAPVPSVAVLPFANMSSDEENEHFSDGLTEELVNKLAGIRGLKVVARTSTYRFKGKKESPAEIAQALQVNHLLDGSVRRSNDRLRISAQLIDARDGEHVWSQTFDRDVGDIFQIQEDIAFAVAAALKVSLLDADEFRVRKHGTSDPEAYRLYVIAQAHLLGRTKTPDWSLAKRLLDTAIDRDPNFAAAHAALARYYFRRVMSTLADPEESEQLGVAAAERAIVLDPDSSEARQAQANFQFWRYRARGDYEAYLAAESNIQRAIELDPANSLAFEDFGGGILWHEPDLALSLFEQAIKLDMLCTGPNVSIAMLLGMRGQLDAARNRCADLRARVPDAIACDMAIATLETYFGNFEQAVALFRAIEKFIRGPARIQLWSVHMSMGDAAGARQWLDFGDTSMEKALSDTARLAMEGRYGQAFMVLERYRKEFPLSHLLDLSAAKFALLAGKPQQAREILEQRLPDLVGGIEPISARSLLPALDLATAQLHTGARDDARVLLGQIAVYLDGPGALRLPLFAFQRARAHALAGEADEALRALDRAYEEGLRTTWALDLRPQSLLYIDPIDADPAFDVLRDDPRLDHWFERIRAANARQLKRLSARQVAKTEN
jgi:TolB-like protein/DNA-binding winged helix-turn-helix (wHTH) protein/Tfp pilus assembly protein PilF